MYDMHFPLLQYSPATIRFVADIIIRLNICNHHHKVSARVVNFPSSSGLRLVVQ